ncbi:acyl-CoA dehydrogenase family protein [Mangrovibrevibacter kandeliae]|uniref:acyl-CoA dehydrogenase family protein n=1 Tax=Mangrovibrevibacter kandeliae TaxID=2968473 RepID=UPI002118BACB|nr:acyl-CoA dehydrogenase family protein [Aurantimonas sp. CSK15Z-1]MCQ8781899.1 acyl-CoA dehydrogenase family protein [Aurantimonas sp. CSK15Z-1]
MDGWIENARMIVESAAAIVPEDGGLDRVRALRFASPGYSPEVFAEIGTMGWLQLAVPERDGGAGLGMRECASLLVALGRGLLPEPVVSALLAQRLTAGRADTDILDGRTVMVAAWQDRTDSLDFAGPAGGDILKLHVDGAAGAGAFAVLAEQGVAIVRAGEPGVRVETAALQDGTFEGTLTLSAGNPEWLPVADADLALDEAILSHSAYLLGLSERGIEITLDYLRVRKQFDQPIGSFQALQHRASELKIQLELCRAAIFRTAARLDAGLSADRRAAAVSRVKTRAAGLAMLMAREAVQMHGAIGTTEEADIGLVVAKAISQANRYGSARLHRNRHFDASERSAA